MRTNYLKNTGSNGKKHKVQGSEAPLSNSPAFKINAHEFHYPKISGAFA